jgi:hypothetical protein
MVLGIFLGTTTAFGATTRFTTATGGVWSATGTWSGGVVPASGDDAVIVSGAAVTVTSAATVKSVTFSNATVAASLTVSPGVTLTITAGLTNRDSATAATSASLQGGGTITCATVTVGGPTTPTANNSDFNTTLTSTVGTLTISGNLIINALYNSAPNAANQGTFALSSGSVSVAGTGGVIMNTVPLFGPTLALDTGSQDGTLTISSATPFTTNGGGSSTFTPGGSAATVVYSASAAQVVKPATYQNLTLAGSLAKTTTGVTVNGVLSRQGTATATVVPVYGQSATIEYAGSAAQTTGAEFTNKIANLTIDNASGVTINVSATVSNVLTLTTGKLITGANILTLGSLASISGGGSSSYVSGNLQKTFNTGSQAFTFLIGDSTSYAPVALSNLSVTASGSIKALTTTGNHPQIATSGINSTQNVSRYWTLTQSGGTFGTYDVTFNYLGSDVDVGADASLFDVAYWNGTLWTASTVNGVPTTNSTSITGQSGFGDFEIGDPTPLPVIWSGGGGANKNWSLGGNWQNGDEPRAVDDVYFFNAGGAVAVSNVNTIVDAGFAGTIGSLNIQNTNNFHTFQIPAGQTLTVNSNFGVGTEDFVSTTQAVFATFTGQGTLNLNLPSNANVNIRQGVASGTNITISAGNPRATLDMSGLDNFTLVARSLSVGIESGAIRRAGGTVYLAKTNTISVSGQTGTGTSFSGNPAINIGHNTQANNQNANGSTLYLGITNAIFGDYFVTGRGNQTNNLMAFNPAFIINNPVAYFRSIDGVSRVTYWMIGDNSPGAIITPSSGTNDFTGGKVDALVDSMFVGRGADNNQSGAAAPGIGTLTFNNGTIDVNSLFVGYQNLGTNIYSTGIGTVNVNSSNATLIVNTSLELGHATNTTIVSPTGTVNIVGGTLRASTIVNGSGSAFITMTNGTLFVTNTFGTVAAPLTSLAMTNSTLTLFVTSTNADGVATSLITGGSTNKINIAALPVITAYPTQFMLLDYSGTIGGAGFNFGLGSLPANSPLFRGYISNNITRASVDLVLTPPPVKLAVTSVNGGSSPVFGSPFTVTVQAQDSGGTARTVVTDTIVTLSLNAGTGSLGGTATGTILAGNSAVTISGVTYSKAESGIVITATETSGETLTAANSSSFTMVPANQTISFPSPGNQTYGVGPIALTASASSGLAVSYAVTAGPATVSGSNLTITGAGSVTIQATQSGNANWNAAPATNQTITVSAKTITGSITASNKVYDGTTAASIATRSLTGVTNSDVVSLTGGTATFATKTVANGKTVTATGLSLTGVDAGKYVLSSTSASTTANITAATLTVSGITATNKVYDRTTTATLNVAGAALVGVVSGDAVTLSTATATGAFADKTVANGKTVTVAGLTISGTDAGNYSLTQPTTTANITSKSLTVSGVTASNKTYDATTNATLNVAGAALVGVVAGDTVNLSTAGATGAFADKNVAAGKTVTVTGMTISGADAANYSLTQPAPTATISAKGLTVSATGVNRIYDGTTNATVTLSDNRLSGDVLTTAYTSASFTSKTVGTGKTVNVAGISISGTDSGNYTANTTATTTANITARTLTVTATGVNRPYDGTTNATVTLSDDRVAGDVLTTSYTSASFATKTIGTGKTVSVTGIAISGADSGNYTANTTASTTANITSRTLTVTATGVNRAYDATTNATVTLSDDRVAGDVLTTSYTSASFTNKTVGVGKTVNVAGISISGADSGNYTANTTATTTANITAKALIVTATGVNRVYDGTTNATVTLSDDRIAGDVLTTSYTSASFTTKTVGNGKTVNVSGISISGADSGNYTANATATTTANITARTLTVTATGVNRAYDGTTNATVTLSDDRVVGDVLTTSYTTASFTTKTVGTGKTVNVSGISVTGADSGNYTANAATTTTANITSRTLTVSATGVNRVYDGTTNATVTLSDDRVAGDILTTSYTAASFTSKTVGTGKTVNVSGISISGADSGNYTANATTTTTANITSRTLTVTATGVNRVYDGTTNATVTLSDNRVAGDVLTTSYTAVSFTTKTVGTGKTVNVSGISITGADSGNYTANATATTTANITSRTLTVTATGVNRVYDGTTNATVTLSDDRVAGDVLTTSYTSASFTTKTVGTGKTVNVSGISISGADSGNYTANATATTTANITSRTLTVTATGVNRVYDGTTNATVTLSDDRVAGDVVTTSYTSASFTSKTVGTGKTVNVSGISITGADSGNYTANATATTTANITSRTLTVTATGVNRVYDGTTNATVTLSDDRVAGDVVTTSYTSASFTSKTVGTGKTVNVSGISITGADSGNYTANATATTAANITSRTLTVSATGVNRVYDGTTNATVTLSDDRVAGDVLTTSYTSASFTSKTVGTGKTVNVGGISITGADSGNYTANATTTTTANITSRTLTVTATGVNRVYDGTTNATVTLSDDRVAGDVLTPNYTVASFTTKTVGTGKTVNVSGISITGADSGNYTANATTTTTANITSRTLTVTATGVNRVYDGTTNATVTLSDDRVAGDVVTTSYTSASFTSKTVGTGKMVNVTGISISGADSGNYTANATATTTANITSRTLTVTATGVNRVYDGTTNATVTLSDDRVAGDVLTTSYTVASFTSKTVGTGKTVNVSGISISGADSGNYTANATATTTANITSRTLTVTATGVNRVYDGTTNATVTLSDDRVAGDVLTTSYTSASFTTKTVGVGKTVNVGGISISGADSGNYTANATTTTTANITSRTLTVSATGVNRVYDGTTNATVTLSDDRIAGDVLTTSYTTASFTGKTVGTGKTVNVSGISISGADSGNYTANPTATTTANITARALTVTATGVNRVYDGTTNATVTLSDDRVAGDVLTTSYTTASFTSKTVGTGKTVNVSGISISGADSGNYTANPTATTTANITARALTVTATGVNRVYDGTTNAMVTLSDDRVAGDVLTTSYTTASFTSKTVGTGKTVNVSGILISGADSGNYTANATATTTANITSRTLTVSATGVNRVYDGTTNATVTLSDDRIAGDVLTTSYTTASFTGKTVGTGKTVNVSGISITGADSGNYTANTTATTTADITARALTVSATGVNRVYDGTTNATVTLSDDRVAGDVLTTSYTTASFTSKTVGTGKTVNVSGISITGADSGNYTANATATTTANITSRTLTVSATGANRVYDGTTNATVTLSDDRVSGDVLTTSYTTASFTSKTVGNGKTVNVSGISIAGADSGNYSANATATTTANITSRTLTVTATGVNRVYDGTTNATVTLSDDRVAGDVLTTSYASASFTTKTVGAAKTVNVSGISITGTDSGNYTANATTTTTANITSRTLTVTAAGVDRIYDGTTNATVTLSDDRVAGDVLTTSYTSASFTSKTVGTGKTVNVTGISISGADSGNYTANATTTTTANITSRTLTVTATGVDRIYDGTTNATVTLSDDRVAGDVLTTSYTSVSFTSKTVGTGKTVNVSGIAISGADSGNYTANTTATTTADISSRTLTVSATGVNRVYDGTTNATVTLSDDRVSGDVLTTSYTSASFTSKTVGTGKTVNVSGISVTGADSGNYTANTTATTTADISSRTLTVSATGVNRVYDGTTNATVTLSDDRVSGDVLTTSYTTASFTSKTVGTGKTVNVSGISISGADSGNYTANATATTTANITVRSLTVMATGIDKVYDGTTAATVTLSDDRIAGDILTNAYTSAAFLNPNVGTGKAVTVSGISISGPDAGNYDANTSRVTTANITPATLITHADDKSRAFGAANPALTAGYTGFVNGENTNVLSGTPGLSTTADTNSPVGSYPIQITIGSLSATNYTFSLTNGTLTVLEVPAILAIDVAGGQVTVHGKGVSPGATYQLEASSNLVDWTNIASLQAAGDGTISFEDPDASQYSARFYRAFKP